MLVAGSVIIGRREEGKELGNAGTAGTKPGQQNFRDEVSAPLTGEGVSSDTEVGREDSIELRRKPKAQAP